MKNNGQWYGMILSIQELQAEFIVGRKYRTVTIIITLTTYPHFVDFPRICLAGKLQLATVSVSLNPSKHVVPDLWCPGK